MARERHAVAQVATGGSCIDVRPTPVGMAAASANQQQLLWLPSNGRCLQSRSSLPRPIGACRGRECGNQQPTHVISSSPHVVHAMHANDAQQQHAAAPMSSISSRSWRQPSGLHHNQSRCATAGAPMLPTAAPHRPRPVRSSRAPLVCLEHHKRASSTVRVASKWRWPESDMQSLRLLQEAAASTSGRLRSTWRWPLHPLTNSSSSGCHRMAGACSPGLRCHGRLPCVEAVSAAINSPLTSSAPPRTWCTRCTCEWYTAAPSEPAQCA